MGKFSFDFGALPLGFHEHRFAARDVAFTAFIWRGGPGPVLFVNGGTHGDEYEGPEVLRGWAHAWRPRRLRGTVVFIPVLNEAAAYAGRRCHPADGGNLARAFPGQARGQPTARLAHLFDTQVLAQCTHYVDLHSAGAACEIDPWVGYMLSTETINRVQHAMAACFDRFWCWAAPPLPARTLSAAHSRRIPAIYVECRGAGGVHPADARALDAGLRHLIARLGLQGRPPPKLPAQRCRISNNADETHLQLHHQAPADGLFRPAVRLRQRVRKGALLGHLFSIESASVSEIHVTQSGRVVKLRRQRPVLRGDSLATVVAI